MDAQSRTQSSFVAVWTGGLTWGSGVGAVLGTVLGFLQGGGWVLDDSASTSEFLIGAPTLGLFGLLVGLGLGFFIGCIAGLAAAFVLSLMLANHAGSRTATGVTVGVMTVLLTAAGWMLGPFMLVVPALAVYPLWRVVGRAV